MIEETGACSNSSSEAAQKAMGGNYARRKKIKQKFPRIKKAMDRNYSCRKKKD